MLDLLNIAKPTLLNWYPFRCAVIVLEISALRGALSAISIRRRG
jgi:hypothetical protein